MFELTLVDHLRLSFGHVVHRHNAHAQIASSRGRWGRGLRATEALLMAGVALASTGAALGRGQVYGVASAVLATLALAALFVHLAFDFDRSAQIHAACATRLWEIRERYRALLSDLSDGAIDMDGGRRRRDELMHELHGIYENAPPEDHPVYQAAARAALVEAETLPDEEIDRFLPVSLQKAGKAHAA